MLRIITIAALAVAIPSLSAAQQHKCQCCGGASSSHAQAVTPQTPTPEPRALAAPRAIPPAYDLEYESMLVGVVESVMRHEGMDVQITLGVGENRMEVIVAPKDWLDEQNFAFRPGERIEIIGSRSVSEANDTIVAREIRTATATMVLRDTEGRPLWNF